MEKHYWCGGMLKLSDYKVLERRVMRNNDHGMKETKASDTSDVSDFRKKTGYVDDLFYDTSSLTHEQQISLLKEAKLLCRLWWVDILDCSKSCARQRTEMLFDEIMARFKKDSHFVFINRKGSDPDGYVLETGFRAMSQVDYFLWIHLDEKYINRFLKRYPLRARI